MYAARSDIWHHVLRPSINSELNRRFLLQKLRSQVEGVFGTAPPESAAVLLRPTRNGRRIFG